MVLGLEGVAEWVGEVDAAVALVGPASTEGGASVDGVDDADTDAVVVAVGAGGAPGPGSGRKAMSASATIARPPTAATTRRRCACSTLVGASRDRSTGSG